VIRRRVESDNLTPGLNAIAVRTDDRITVFVSEAIPARLQRARRTDPRGHDRRGSHRTGPHAACPGRHHASHAEQHPTCSRGYQASSPFAAAGANAQAWPGPRRSSRAAAESADPHCDARPDPSHADRVVAESGLVAGPQPFSEPDENQALHSCAVLLRNRSLPAAICAHDVRRGARPPRQGLPRRTLPGRTAQPSRSGEDAGQAGAADTTQVIPVR
jgi:hypothetical protein